MRAFAVCGALLMSLTLVPGCSESSNDGEFGEREGVPADPAALKKQAAGQANTAFEAAKGEAVGTMPAPLKLAKHAENAVYFCVQSVGVVRLDDAGFKRVGDNKSLYCKDMFVGPVDGAAHLVGWSIDKVSAAGREAVAPKALIGGSIHDMGALGPNGSKLAATFRTLYFNNGKKWTKYDQVAIGFKEGSLKDAYIDAKGRVFAATNYAFYVLDGPTWRTIFNSADKKDKYFIENFLVMDDGRVLFNLSGKLGIYDGKTLTTHKITGLSSKSIHLGADGFVYVISSAGVTGYDLESFTAQKAFSLADSRIKAKRISHGSMDAQGRFWLVSDGGIIVLDKDLGHTLWPTGSMPAIAGSVGAILAVGQGPAQLPKVGKVVTGNIHGQFFHGPKPAVGVPVELCDYPATMFQKSPCADKAFSRSTKTDANGEFLFRSIPLNAYGVTAKINGKWHRTLGTPCKQLKAGQTCEVGRITVKAP